jgi:membrane protease YdiL (CAAX protease family)
MKIKIIAPLMAYVTVAIGMFWARSAWVALLGFHAAIIGSLMVAKPNIRLKNLFKVNHVKWILMSVLLCGSSGIVLYFLWPHFGISDDLAEQLESLGLTTSTWPVFIAYFSLINPFVEEYFWRGYLGNITAGFHIYDAIYAGYHALVLIGKVHFASIIFAFAMLTLAAWFWRQVTHKDGGLLAAVLGHLTADLSILLTVRWMCS